MKILSALANLEKIEIITEKVESSDDVPYYAYHLNSKKTRSCPNPPPNRYLKNVCKLLGIYEEDLASLIISGETGREPEEFSDDEVEGTIKGRSGNKNARYHKLLKDFNWSLKSQRERD